MKRFVQISDEHTKLFGYRIRNSRLSLHIGIFQLLVCLWSLTQHVYSLLTFNKILYCDFSANSTLPGMLTAVDAIIFDVGLFHSLWGIHGCVAQHLDGGYGRFTWCVTHIISLCVCLPFAFVHRPKPQFLWPMLVQQSTYGIGLLILSLAALPRVLPTLMGELSSAPLHAILIYLFGTFVNYFLLYVYWHWYWHVEMQWDSARKTRADLLQQNHSRRTGALVTLAKNDAAGIISGAASIKSNSLPNNAIIMNGDTIPHRTVRLKDTTMDENTVVRKGLISKNATVGNGRINEMLLAKAPLTAAVSNPPSTVKYWRNRQRQQQQQQQLRLQSGQVSSSETAVTLKADNGRPSVSIVSPLTLPCDDYDKAYGLILPFKTTVLVNSSYCENRSPPLSDITRASDTRWMNRLNCTQESDWDVSYSAAASLGLLAYKNKLVDDFNSRTDSVPYSGAYPSSHSDISFCGINNRSLGLEASFYGNRRQSFCVTAPSAPDEILDSECCRLNPRLKHAPIIQQNSLSSSSNSALKNAKAFLSRSHSRKSHQIGALPSVVVLGNKKQQSSLMLQAIQNANLYKNTVTKSTAISGPYQAMSLKRYVDEAPKTQMNTSMSLTHFNPALIQNAMAASNQRNSLCYDAFNKQYTTETSNGQLNGQSVSQQCTNTVNNILIDNSLAYNTSRYNQAYTAVGVSDHSLTASGRKLLTDKSRNSVQLRRESWRRNRQTAANIPSSSARTRPGPAVAQEEIQHLMHELSAAFTPSPNASAEGSTTASPILQMNADENSSLASATATADAHILPPRVRCLKMEKTNAQPARELSADCAKKSSISMAGSSSNSSISVASASNFKKTNNYDDEYDYVRNSYSAAAQTTTINNLWRPLNEYGFETSTRAITPVITDARRHHRILRRAMTHDGGGCGDSRNYKLDYSRRGVVPLSALQQQQKYVAENKRRLKLQNECELQLQKTIVAKELQYDDYEATLQNLQPPYNIPSTCDYDIISNKCDNSYAYGPSFCTEDELLFKNNVEYGNSPTIAYNNDVPYESVVHMPYCTSYGAQKSAIQQTRKLYLLKKRIHSSPTIRVDPTAMQMQQRITPPKLSANQTQATYNPLHQLNRLDLGHIIDSRQAINRVNSYKMNSNKEYRSINPNEKLCSERSTETNINSVDKFKPTANTECQFQRYDYR